MIMLVLAVIDLYTKLEISMFTHYEDMKGNKMPKIGVVGGVRGHSRSSAT